MDAFESDVVGRLAETGLLIFAANGERGCELFRGNVVAGLDVEVWTLVAGRFALSVVPDGVVRAGGVLLLNRCFAGDFCGVLGFAGDCCGVLDFACSGLGVALVVRADEVVLMDCLFAGVFCGVLGFGCSSLGEASVAFAKVALWSDSKTLTFSSCERD